jgi:dTDP-4-dehydrorhamnose reductase
MTPRILLTGITGQVGGELEQLLPRIGEVAGFDRQHLDLSKPEEIRRTIREVRPQLIINATAYNAVDQAEREEAIARAINTDALALMAEEAKEIDAGLVHYSTDYVFDGTKKSPYQEDDATNPLNAYALTKLAGEQAIQDSGVSHLIFRTAWVYGTRGSNFLLTILRLASEREELKIVCDQTGTPTWSYAIAAATTQILAKHINRTRNQFLLEESSGIYHMTAGGQTSRYEFTNAILKEAAAAPQNLPWFAAATGGRPRKVLRVLPISTSEYPTPARRPAYSVLDSSRLLRQFGIQFPDWQTQLHQVFTDPPQSTHDSKLSTK